MNDNIVVILRKMEFSQSLSRKGRSFNIFNTIVEKSLISENPRKIFEISFFKLVFLMT